jgi:cytochrome c peroxidase
MRPLATVLAAAAGLGILIAGLAAGPAREQPAETRAAARVELGRRLFYDADLSIDGTLSCATCHEQRRAFTEGNRTHPGVHDTPGRRNVPGLANVADFKTLTWADPTLTSLEAQMLVPLAGEHPVEMGMGGKTDLLPGRLGGDPCYRRMFADAFAGDPAITLPRVVQAIAAFERTLISGNAPFDRYRRGETDALSPDARRGEALFFGARLGCGECHSGPDLTDGGYHNIGLPPPTGADPDHGLIEKTLNPADEGRFRTPSLRNAALTAPYLHDGAAASLADAVRAHFAGAGQDTARDPILRGRALRDDDLAPLLAFLGSLTDQQFVTDPRFSLPNTACGKSL